jgi:4-hydroxythreonine-4-phosphate dehydrogenase
MPGRGERLKVGISLGDVTGIGPELIIKTFLDDRIFKQLTPVLFGNARVLSFYKKLLNIERFQYNSVKNFQQLSYNSLNIIPVWDEEFTIEPGKPDEQSGKYALLSLEAACKALRDGEIDVLVTAPINKKYIYSEAFPFNGHTHYLKEQLGGDDVLMFMVSDNIRVGLVTEHLAIREIADHIKEEDILSKLRMMQSSLVKDFGIEKPRIAVLGLNPHAGDEGLIGHEEQEIILPAIRKATKEGILAFGPYPADGFFAKGSYKSFDGILAMYHDQGLIPFKSLSHDNGTNFTAGLPYVRTSPDHGTAEQIAGKDLADESSFRTAIYTAIDIWHNRKEYEERNSDPLIKRANLRDEDR